jgi:hypothetical protein
MPKKYLAGIVVVGIIIFVFTRQHVVYAAIASCTASVSPSALDPDSTTTLVFSLRNTDGSNAVQWFRISRPSSHYTINGTSAGGWSASTTSSTATYTLGSLDPGSSQNVTVEVTTDNSQVNPEAWSIQMSDDPIGASPTDCTGSHSTSIGSPQATATPTPTNTNTPSPTPTSTYTPTPQPTATPTNTQTPAPTLPPGVTATPTNSPSPTSTTTGTNSTSTATPTPTSTATALDTTRPVIQLLTTSSFFVKNTVPTIQGQATDANSVTHIEYVLDTGNAYVPISGLQLSRASVPFSFIPLISTDGYHTIQLRAGDAAGNTGYSAKLSFTLDKTPPVLTLRTDMTKTYKESPVIEGMASDANGISRVEYNINNSGWWSVETQTVVGAKTVPFRFTPEVQGDGNYDIQISSQDTAGNRSILPGNTLIIDRLPPSIGTSVMTIGTMVLQPDENGSVTVTSGTDLSLYASAVGGPIHIDLYLAPTGFITHEQKLTSLVRNSIDLVWNGHFPLNKTGEYRLLSKSYDGAGNTTNQYIGFIRVTEKGKVIKNAAQSRFTQLTVLTDNSDGMFVPWDGLPWEEPNPQLIPSSGEYTLTLPEGDYSLLINSAGYYPTRTQVFHLQHPSVIGSNLTLTPRPGIVIGPLQLSLPNIPWIYHSAPSPVLPNNRSTTPVSPLIGTALPSLPATSVDGQPASLGHASSLIVILASWMPNVDRIIARLESLQAKRGQNIFLLMPSEQPAKLAVFAKRGKYQMPILADSDNAFVNLLGIHTIPTYIYVNESGIIQSVRYGDMP